VNDLAAKRKKVRKSYSSKTAAQREAARQRAKGNRATVRYDRASGKWIVDVVILLIALSVFGSLLRSNN
jgi:hypothetical protein